MSDANPPVIEYGSHPRTREPGWFERFLLHPIGWPTHAACTLVVLAMLYAKSAPGGYFVVKVWSLLTGLVVGGWWLARGVCRIAMQIRAQGRLNFSDRAWLRWAVATVLYGVLML